MVPRFSLPTLLALPSLAFGPQAGALAATELDGLEPGARETIARRCLALQYGEGVAAYRRCVLDAARAATPLDALPFDDRHALDRACEDARRESRAVGGACLESGLAALAGVPAPPLDTLRRDEREAIRRECDDAASRAGIAGYRRCVDGALDALDSLPSVDLAALTLRERGVLARRCATSDGAVGYRRCLLDATGAVATDAPEPPGSTVTGEPSSDARAVAATETPGGAVGEDAPEDLARLADAVPAPTGPADAGRADATPSPGAPAAAITTVGGTATAADASVDVDAPPTAQADAADGLDPSVAADPVAEAPDTSGLQDRATETTPAASASDAGREPGEAGPPDSGRRAREAWTRLQATVAGLDTLERVVLGAALVLPLSLLGAWLALRGRRRPVGRERIAAYTAAPPADPFAERETRSPWLDERGEELSAMFDDTLESPPPPSWTDDVDDDARGTRAAPLGTDAREPADDDATVTRAAPLGTDAREPADDDAVGRGAATSGSGTRESRAPGPDERPVGSERPADGDEDANARRADRLPPREPATVDTDERSPEEPHRPPLSPFEPRSAFGRELAAEAETLGRQRAIEFLIYWMAYGDERYAPGTRAALLRDGGDTADPHERIKRRVLERDTHAFADTVRWLQRHAAELQRVQIVDLLMVLLVSEGAMTPVQNTLLRFLADAFGLGEDALEERHELAFGEPMPRLPRVDLPLWWAGVDPDRPLRWDARALAELDEHVQCRVRLGLPLDGELGEEQIVEAFRRAARRCHPHRFDALGEREQGLAERQFGKFEQARDRLLGVSA